MLGAGRVFTHDFLIYFLLVPSVNMFSLQQTRLEILKGFELLKQGRRGYPRAHPPLKETDIDWASASHSLRGYRYPLQSNDLNHPTDLGDAFAGESVFIDASCLNFWAGVSDDEDDDVYKVQELLLFIAF